MAKKKEVLEPAEVKAGREEAFEAPIEPKKVGKLDLTFNQADLNKLVSKINEIIENI